MIVIIILTVIFAIMGIVFARGKGGFLIAGYNTASNKDKAKYDEKRLNRCFSIFCFGIAIVIGVTGYIDTEAFAVRVGLTRQVPACRAEKQAKKISRKSSITQYI